MKNRYYYIQSTNCFYCLNDSSLVFFDRYENWMPSRFSFEEIEAKMRTFSELELQYLGVPYTEHEFTWSMKSESIIRKATNLEKEYYGLC